MLALLVPSCAVMAQTTTEPDPNDPCASQLGQQSPKGEDEDKAAGTDQKDGSNAETGERLARCGDVLTPPKTGDTELVQPAPETGTTPVIRPKVLPKQQESDPDAQ
jgi:hypothetical protein